MIDDQKRGRVAMLVNSAWNIHNFRRSLISALMDAGYDVVALAPQGRYADRLPCAFHPIPMSGRGANPIADGLLFARIVRELARLRPDVLLNFTIKPNIYGTFAARLLGIPTINNISGLGTAFLDDSAAARVAQWLYSWSQTLATWVFFQNEEDRSFFLSRSPLPAERTSVLPGSGIDTDQFSPRESRAEFGRFRFLLIARLLADKGVREFVGAARLLRDEGLDAEFQLLGQVSPDNRTAIPQNELQEWICAGHVRYLGETEDVRESIAAADCVVLPSYREGLPRTLLEAASMAKPVVATDVPGCRDVVVDGETGLMCRVRDTASLADAMRRLACSDRAVRERMGMAGRARVLERFGEARVLECYLHEIERLRGRRAAGVIGQLRSRRLPPRVR